MALKSRVSARNELLRATLVASIGAGAAILAIAVSPLMAEYPQMMMSSLVEGIQEFGVYGVAFFVLFTCLLAGVAPKRRLSRRRWPQWRDVLRESIFSLAAQFVFLAVAVWTNWAPREMVANAYTDLSPVGWPYLILTVLLVFFAHDTAFYWAHRLMHHPWFFERVHRVHHQSVDPTPFATSAFHPIEVVVEGLAALAPIAIYVAMPWHVSVPVIWGIGQILFNVIGHAGFEIYPRHWLNWPLLRWKTPALHHYMHHQRVGGNYGLYFRIWDKLCGTEFKDFEQRYEQLFEASARTDESVGGSRSD